MLSSSNKFLAMLLLPALAIGCDAADKVDNRLDCREICDRYSECFDGDYDTDECKNECRDNANEDADFESKVEKCSDCIDSDDSCSEDTFSCADECIGVVP